MRDSAPEPVEDMLDGTSRPPRKGSEFTTVPQTKDALGNLFPDIDAIGGSKKQDKPSDFDPFASKNGESTDPFASNNTTSTDPFASNNAKSTDPFASQPPLSSTTSPDPFSIAGISDPFTPTPTQNPMVNNINQFHTTNSKS